MGDNRIHIGWLFAAGTILLTAGFLMRAFPILVFAGLAPFFAILDYTIEEENFWEHAELILIGLAVSFFAAFAFDLDSIVTALILAILFTLPFIGFAFVHEHLGARTGKFVVIFLWLGIEYALVKLQWPSKMYFLADGLSSWPQWFRWNTETGYLGISAWILVTNWLLYTGTLRNGLQWPLILLGLVCLAGPLIYSYTLETKAILHSTMVELYQSNSVVPVDYSARGELVARTCAWVSVLILVFAGVKSRTSQ